MKLHSNSNARLKKQVDEPGNTVLNKEDFESKVICSKTSPSGDGG